MMKGLQTAHRRANSALMCASALLVATIAPAMVLGLYTDNPVFAASPHQGTAVAMVSAEDASLIEASAERDCLAEVMYYEARGEGSEGQKAVAEVVLQRTHDRNYPATICGVVHEGAQADRRSVCQFSFACDGSTKRPKEAAAWNRVRMLASEIVTGRVHLSNETDHAIAFHSIDVEPDWADTMLRTAQIGNHVFYRRAPVGVTLANAPLEGERPSSGILLPNGDIEPVTAVPASQEVPADAVPTPATGNGA